MFLPFTKRSLLIISSFLTTNSYANDFAYGHWDDSKELLLNREQRTNTTTPDSTQLTFKGEVAHFSDALIVYQFENNQLRSGFFDFNHQHILFQDYINDYFLMLAHMC